jgi:hypothetical protein
LTGNFSYEVPLSDAITAVRFGTERTVIWKRGSGTVQMKR